MPARISLKDVVDALDMTDDMNHYFLNRETGELFSINEDETELDLTDPDFCEDDLPDWQRELVPNLREIYETDRWIALPNSFDIHAWSIMADFANSRGRSAQRTQLLEAIHGGGAFRRFKDAAARLALLEDWYTFRDAALTQIARDWLDANELEYSLPDASGPADAH